MVPAVHDDPSSRADGCWSVDSLKRAAEAATEPQDDYISSLPTSLGGASKVAPHHAGESRWDWDRDARGLATSLRLTWASSNPYLSRSSLDLCFFFEYFSLCHSPCELNAVTLATPLLLCMRGAASFTPSSYVDYAEHPTCMQVAGHSFQTASTPQYPSLHTPFPTDWFALRH